ncbi:hypothetical protein N7523_001020 [Penicillium sp. IBT 18751x]|nr:hypothetical protein N7523_001020 [Penicillium sp. IBT 18751x]
MADQCTMRLMRELNALERSDQLAMTVHYEEENVREISALLLGPPGTPYALGFYEFTFSVPSDYPASPPTVLIKTTNQGETRFGPNLYAMGKVCLSILGTWHASHGEEWSAAQGLESVLLSIQSLLSATPYFNEPGYEDHNKESDKQNVELYNSKIRHENLRLAVIQPLEEALGLIAPESMSYFHRLKHSQTAKSKTFETLEGSESERQSGHHTEIPKTGPFDDFRKQRFLWYLEQYEEAVQYGVEKEASRHGTRFPYVSFESRGNAMNGEWNYPDLQKRMKVLETKILEETYAWPAEGKRLAEEDAGIAVSLRAQHEQIVSGLARRADSIVDLTMEHDNPFLWKLVYFGRPMTQYDGGILKIKIYISARHPNEQPRVFVETPLFHVRVSTRKVLIYLPARAEEMNCHIEGIISSIEDDSPPYNPLMTVNQEATKLFWGSEDEQKRYHRKLRRSVEESVA